MIPSANTSVVIRTSYLSLFLFLNLGLKLSSIMDFCMRLLEPVYAVTLSPNIGSNSLSRYSAVSLDSVKIIFLLPISFLLSVSSTLNCSNFGSTEILLHKSIRYLSFAKSHSKSLINLGSNSSDLKCITVSSSTSFISFSSSPLSSMSYTSTFLLIYTSPL